jgi:hypothetical protein
MHPRSLTVLNAVAAVLCFASFVAILATTTDIDHITFTRPSSSLDDPTPVSITSANPGVLVALFLLVSAVEHTAALLLPVYYDRSLGAISTLRWISYAISAPIMTVIIYASMLITDLWLNVLAAIICAVMISTGFFYELDRCIHYDKPKYYIPIFAVGFFLLSAIFVPIWYQYSCFNPPALVHSIIATMTICFWSFGFVPVLSLYFSEKAPFITSEKAYICLSITSKQLLAWLFAARYLTM